MQLMNTTRGKEGLASKKQEKLIKNSGEIRTRGELWGGGDNNYCVIELTLNNPFEKWKWWVKCPKTL